MDKPDNDQINQDVKELEDEELDKVSGGNVDAGQSWQASGNHGDVVSHGHTIFK